MTVSKPETVESQSWVTVVICASCGGEFDEGEWDADTRCPECEQPKRWKEKRTSLLGSNPPAFARQDGLREALEPFAQALDDWGDEGGGGNFDIYEHPTAINITLDHLRDAKKALAALFDTPPPDNEETEALREAVRKEVINSPETADFMAGVPLEAAHQRERWGASHDAGKTPFDWFWLVGYLAQKAASSAVAGDTEKAMHHTISTAAALANWHAALTGAHTLMRPGIGPGNGGEKQGSAHDMASSLSAFNNGGK